MDKSLRTSQLGQASKPVQPLPNSQISNSQIQLFEQFQHEKITKTRLEKQLRSSKLQIPVSINSDIQNRMVNLWDALEVSVKERHYAYTVLRESQEQALNYINKMRQILFHRRRFEELTSRREQIAEQLRVMLQQGKGSKKDLLTNAIQVRMMTLELFTIFNSARKYVKKPIDLPSLNVLNYSFPKRLLGESVFSRENLIVAMCVVRFFGKSSYNSVKSQVNQIFDQLIIDGSNENEVSFSFMIGQQLLNSSIPLQFHQFLVQTFQDLYDVNLDQYLPRNLIKLDLVKNIMKQENQAYSEYIKKVTTIQNQDLDICVVPIKDDILFDPNISYIDGWSIEEINKINLTFKHTLSKKFSPQRLLQDMRNSKLNITKTQVQNVNKQKIQATLQLQEDLLPFEEIEPEIMQQPQIFTCQMAKPAKIEAAFTEEAFDEEPAMPAKIEAAFDEEAFDEEPAMPAKIEAAFTEEAFDEEPAMPAKIEAAFDEEAFDEEPAMPAKIEAAFTEEAFDEEPTMPAKIEAAFDEEAFDEEPAMPAKIEAAFTEEAFDEEPAMPAKIEAAFTEEAFDEEPAMPAKIEAAFDEEAFDEEPAMPAKIEAAFTEEAFDEEPAMPAKIEAAFDEEAFDEEPAMPAKIEAAFTEEAFDEEPAMPAKIEAAFDEEAFDEEPAMPAKIEAAFTEEAFDEEPAMPAKIEAAFTEEAFDEEPAMPAKIEAAFTEEAFDEEPAMPAKIEAAFDEEAFDEEPAMPAKIEAAFDEEAFDEEPAMPAKIEAAFTEEAFDEEPAMPAKIEAAFDEEAFDEEPAMPVTVDAALEEIIVQSHTDNRLGLNNVSYHFDQEFEANGFED